MTIVYLPNVKAGRIYTFFNGGEVSVAADRVIRYVLIDNDGPTGKFFSEETNPSTGEIPW